MKRKPTPVERMLFLSAALLAGYQVAVGIEGLGRFEITCYTIGFGVILVASLLLMIMGYEVLGTPAVVVLSTLIPLSVSTGLVAQFLPQFLAGYLIFAAVGLAAVVVTRFLFRSGSGEIRKPTRNATATLAVVHSIAGLVIFLLPLFVIRKEEVPAGFGMVGIGGALFGLVGILLSFLRAGRSPLPAEKIIRALPWVLVLTTAAFVAGFSFV